MSHSLTWTEWRRVRFHWLITPLLSLQGGCFHTVIKWSQTTGFVIHEKRVIDACSRRHQLWVKESRMPAMKPSWTCFRFFHKWRRHTPQRQGRHCAQHLTSVVALIHFIGNIRRSLSDRVVRQKATSSGWREMVLTKQLVELLELSLLWRSAFLISKRFY